MDPHAYRALRASAYRVIVWGLLYILRGLNHYWNVQWTMKRPLHHWDHIDCYSLLYAVYILFLVKDGYTTMGVGRIFSRGGSVGDCPKIFFRAGQKWWNLVFTPRNWEKQAFLLIISKSRGGQTPLPHPSDAHVLHEILTYINVYICEVDMPPSYPLIFSFDSLE